MQYKETGMSGFSVKRVNVVGAFASLWAFIFAFFPFYRIEPMEVRKYLYSRQGSRLNHML